MPGQNNAIAIPPVRKKKRATREESRSILLDAAEAIIRKEGVAGITTVSVTARAGFAQSAFYHHFKGVDELLQAAGDRIARKIRESVASERRRMQRENLGDFERELAFYLFVLKIFEEPGVAEIILKNRFDQTPLGKVISDLVAGLRQDLADDLWAVAKTLGVGRKRRPQSDILADFLLANTLAAGEAMIDGRVTDRELLASQLTITMRAACAAVFENDPTNPS